MNEQITAQEIINFIESGFSGIITADAKHFCIKGAIQSKQFAGRNIAVDEFIKLMNWEDVEMGE